MAVWFVRSNGVTCHNDPSCSDLFVQGEAPSFPEKAFDYREKCLAEGFARIGWPNVGDLRRLGHGQLAVGGYGLTDVEPHVEKYLESFRGIVTGDFLVIPAGGRPGEVHLGKAVLRDRITRELLSIRPGTEAYYFFHDLGNGQWYECSHRVDVLWDRKPDGSFAVHEIPGLGGLWLRAFGPVRKGQDFVLGLASEVGL